MVLLAHRVAVVGMGVPRHPPAAMDVAVVPAEKEVERADERGDEGDVRERPADAVVAPWFGQWTM
jgi:hypothetical protein